MGIELAKRELEIIEVKSRRTFVSLPPEEAALREYVRRCMEKAAAAFVWTLPAVSCGFWNGAEFFWRRGNWEMRDVLELRIFNEKEELHLIRHADVLSGRHIVDGEGAVGSAVDSFSRFWGQLDAEASPPDGFVSLADKSRKIRLDVPYRGETRHLSYLGLTTRNYIGCDSETGLSGYVDSRFVAIEPAEEV